MCDVKISVIVPVWGTENYLDKCLNSLVNQTCQDIEIIIVNDESPDSSQLIIEHYAEKYPQKVKAFFKQNGGLSSARNFGLEKAKGEYISFVDSDDWLDLNALEEMVHQATKENSDVVICDMIDHYDNHTVYHHCTMCHSVYEGTPSACNKIFRMSAIADLRFKEKIWYEDLNFTTKILLQTDKISTVSKGFYHCHCREVSTMNNNNSLKNLDIIVSVDDLIEYTKKVNCFNQAVISQLIFNHILITAVNRVAMQKSADKKVVIHQLIDYCRKTISNYKSEEYYLDVERNRKIIASLNYHRLWFISKCILKIKAYLVKVKR